MKAVRLSLALLLAFSHVLGASLPLAPVGELFPVVPHPQAESGSAVALDSGWLVVGAPLDNAAGKDAGAVRVFRWAAGFWMQKAELLPSLPQEGARFGSAVAIRGGLLVVGAVGEGAVYLFEEDENNSWKQTARLSRGESERGSFGRSLALDRAADRVRLAVGSVAADGTGGVVYVYNGPDWAEPEAVRPLIPQPADGFGTSVALDRCVLAVGAPGYDLDALRLDAGVVFAFEQQETWRQAGQLMAVDAQAGDGLGSAVAAACNEIVAGAPGADRAGEDSGATFAFQRTRGVWMPWQALGAVAPGERLGSALALDRDLLAIGAPRGRAAAGRTGHVRLYRQNAGGTWEPAGVLAADNAEAEDLAGFALAARHGRVVVGAPLGDQGAPSAGAVWTFLCGDDEAGCIQEGEAVSTAMAWGDRFGTALATDRANGNLLAATLSPGDGSPGAVHLYRRAGLGWRQQARLTSGAKSFGTALAVEGRTVVAGAPSAGEVYVFREVQGEWRLRLRLTAPQPRPGDGFGGAVALRAGVIAVSARLDAKGSEAGAVYLFPAGSTSSAEGLPLPRVATPGSGYGATLALGGEEGDIVAVGAPLSGSGGGSVYIFQWNGSSWVRRRLSAGRAGVGLGTSLALEGDTLLAGAPGARRGAGAAYRFVRTGFDWSRAEELPGRAGSERLGLAVDLRGDLAAVLALGGSGRRDEIDALVFDLPQKGWQLPDRVEFSAPGSIRIAIPPAVAVGEGFCAVSIPGPFPGDRVYVVRLGEPSSKAIIASTNPSSPGVTASATDSTPCRRSSALVTGPIETAESSTRRHSQSAPNRPAKLRTIRGLVKVTQPIGVLANSSSARRGASAGRPLS